MQGLQIHDYNGPILDSKNTDLNIKNSNFINIKLPSNKNFMHLTQNKVVITDIVISDISGSSIYSQIFAINSEIILIRLQV